MRTTAAQIAREAGVSTATVDRVLNHRDGMRTRTRDIVMKVATDLGYFGPAEGHSEHAKLDFILPAGPNSFMQALRRYLIDEGQTYGPCNVTVHQIEGFDPGGLSRKLLELRGQTDAVGLVALDHPEVREAINALAQSGVSVCTMVSDILTVKKVGYVGIDNRAAGRLAGMLIGRFLPTAATPQRVALFAGSLAYRGHEEREMGFRSMISEGFPNISISSIAEVSDDRDLAYEETVRVLADENISAIYSIGSGNQGIARALYEKSMGPDFVYVAHDLTEATRIMLIDRTLDAVIDQNPRIQAREAVKLLVSATLGATKPEQPPPLQVVFRENIPAI